MGVKLSQEEVIRRIKKNFKQDVSLISEYKNKRSKVKLHCNECGYEWEASAQTVIDNNSCHVCPNCNNIKQKFHCAYCNKEIYRIPSEIKRNKSGYFYCSKTCGNLHKNLLRKTSGEWNNSKNYRLKAFEKLEHCCASCGWNEDERILEVHHIDENRDNNNIDNLCILCPTCHRKLTSHYYVLTPSFKIVLK